MIDPKHQKQRQPNNAVAMKSAPAKVVMIAKAPSHEAIRERAYELYEGRGREPGQDEQDWFRAEREILERAG